MNSYKIPEEITKKIQKISSDEKTRGKLNDLFDKLDAVSSKFQVNADVIKPDKVSLEKMEFEKPTTAEIRQNSENLLADYKNKNIKNINDEFKHKEDELHSNKQSVINLTDESKNKLNDYYKQAKTNAEEQALKRGLSRSSIIINQLAAFDDDKINEYKLLDDKLKNDINAINFELNALTTQKQAALNNFDVSYAVKLQEKINELTADLNKTEAEVIKYNNEIALKEAEFNKDVDELSNKINSSNFDDAESLTKLYGEYGQNIVEKVKQDQLYNVAYNYLKDLTKNEIDVILADDNFKTKMGVNYEKIVKDFR